MIMSSQNYGLFLTYTNDFWLKVFTLINHYIDRRVIEL